MQLRLKVIGGKNDGHEIEIKGPEFFIGRGEGVHLRPRSELVSRKHCSLYVNEGRAYVRDLDSSNGTFLNGERIQGEVQLKVGDRLRVGRLQFEILLDHAVPSEKRPKVSGVKDAAVRAVAAVSDVEENMDESITDWLSEADDGRKAEEDFSATRQFKLDETDRTYTPETLTTAEQETVDKGDEDSVDELDPKKAKKKKPGKLPERPKTDTNNSKDAASQMLRQFFNRR